MVTVSYLVHYDTLLQNATDTQNTIVILLQNARNVYYKKPYLFYYIISRQFYHKIL